MVGGSRKANYKSKQKESSIFTASPFKRYATNMSSLVNPLKKPSNKDFAMLVIPTRKRSTSTQNGRKTVSKCMKMDLGEIHTMGAFCENGQALLITGRKVRSLHRLRNKKLAKIQRRQSKCQKGSRQWKKYERAKRYVLSKSERQLRDALHKTTKQFVDWCLAQSGSDVYIGKVEGVQRNTRKKKRANRKQAQRLSNWSFGKVKQYLAYKLAQHGIRLKEVEETYTSQTCPVCQKRKKVSTRIFACSCGYEEHRDIHGARNILSKAVYQKIIPREVPTKLTYLRIA
jgi:putative transposase